MKLGQLLVKKGVIEPDQLRTALERQRGSGVRLGEMLVRMGVASRKSVLDALRTKPEFNADPVALEKADLEAVRTIPRSLAREIGCLALARENGRLVVAMSDPLDTRSIDRLEELTGLEIEPRLAEDEELEEAIEEKFKVQVGTIYQGRQVDEGIEDRVSVVHPTGARRPTGDDRSGRREEDRRQESSSRSGRRRRRRGLIRSG